MASVARKDAKRFSSLNLGTTYKGAKPEAKGAGNKGGFQSLGKIQGKRMPGPAQLPSLRKENAGNDPNVNLVPQAGGGWGMGKEDEAENKELPNQLPASQPVTQSQDVQTATQQSTGGRETGVKKEGIWATPEANSVGPANVPPNQHFKKNFPSLEEREARGTKRTITNELHHDSVPFNEMDNMSNVPPPPAMPPGHYHFAPRPRPPYAAAPSHMGPPYIPRGMPAFRHGMPPPPAEYNHYSHHGGAYRGYPPQQQPGPPPNSATGGQYQYPVPRYHLPPNSSLPHNMDPYQDGQAKLVKSEELKNLELPDEDDDVGGWAGYHEEVDYSKKVVFNDSSDDEERENHQEHQQRQLKRKEIHERESTSREMRMQEVPPLAAVEQPHLHADQSNKHLHTATADLQYFQQHSQSGGSHYPLYYTAHPPQRAYPITVASRPVEKERPHQVPQSDLQPIWQQNRRPKGVPPPESAWGDDKLVTSPAVTQSSTVQSIANEQLESIQQQLEQTTLNDSDSNVTALSAEKKHVTFHLEQQQPAAPPAARQPLKIMMRDMKLSARDENDQTSTTENFHHGNMVKNPYHHRPNDADHQHAVNIDRSLQQQQKISAWKAADRGPITTPRTLYEPEGDKSAKKFNALIKQTSSERGKRGSVSDSTQDGEQVQSPSGDIKILKAEEKQSKGKPTATTPTDEVTTVHSKPQQTSHKNKTAESSSTTAKKGSKRERPSFRQYQPPAAREQDEQSYPESKGSGRRSSRQDYNYEQQGDSRSQRRRDRPPSEGKYHSDKRYSSDSKHQTEGKPQPDGKTQSESKHHPEGKRQVDSSNRRENKSRKEREASKEPPASTHEQTEQHTAIAADVSKEDVSKSEHSQEDKTKQSAKDSHSKGGGDTKHRKKNTTASGPATQKSDGSISREKSRGRGRGRGSNNDDWYYSDEYYNHWYASGGYDSYYYYYDDYNYYSDRRAPSGRQKQQQQQQQSYDGSKNTSERRDTGGKKYQQQQQQTDRGSNRPARTRGGDRKDEASEDKPHQHRATKDKSREVSGEEVSRSKAAEEADIRDRGRRRDSKPQHQESNIDKKRSSRTAGSKATAPHSTSSSSKSSASHDPTTRGQSRASSNKASVSQDRPQQSDTQQHSTASENSSGKKEPAIKDKAASAKMANVDINSPTVFVIDEEQTIPLPSTSSENDDFIRVTSKKEKREMKEQEKHRQQEKQRKAEEEENKKKQHSTRKSSQKTKYQQQQHQLQEQSLPHEDQSLSSTWSTTTTTTVSNASIWSESITSLLNEGVSQTSYMAAAHSSLMAPGDYQLFPTSSYSSSSAPLAHLSAAVDSSVAQDLPTSAAQGHSLSETDVKPAGVGRPDTSSAGHGAIRTDLPLSKSHSSASVGGAIGRGRGSSSSRAPGSNRGSSSRDSSKKLPASSSDSKLTSSTSPKISKPSSAVRSKPSATANTVSSSDKVA